MILRMIHGMTNCCLKRILRMKNHHLLNILRCFLKMIFRMNNYMKNVMLMNLKNIPNCSLNFFLMALNMYSGYYMRVPTWFAQMSRTNYWSSEYCSLMFQDKLNVVSPDYC